MKLNSFFSFSRFYLLMRNDMMLNYKKYLLTIIGTFIVGYVILYMQMPTRENSNDFESWNYSLTFMICLIGLGSFIGMSFPAFSSKTMTINYLLFPSSTFEKLLSQFVIRIVIGTGLFFLIYWIDAYFARETAIIVLSKFENAAKIKPFQYSNLLYNMSKNDILDILSMIMFFVSIGFYLFSVRLYFKKNALVKTAISMGVAVFLLILILYILSHIFYPETKGSDIQLNEYKVYLRYSNFEIWLYAMINLSWIFILPFGYFKLKEKQL